MGSALNKFLSSAFNAFLSSELFALDAFLNSALDSQIISELGTQCICGLGSWLSIHFQARLTHDSRALVRKQIVIKHCVNTSRGLRGDGCGHDPVESKVVVHFVTHLQQP